MAFSAPAGFSSGSASGIGAAVASQQAAQSQSQGQSQQSKAGASGGGYSSASGTSKAAPAPQAVPVQSQSPASTQAIAGQISSSPVAIQQATAQAAQKGIVSLGGYSPNTVSGAVMYGALQSDVAAVKAGGGGITPQQGLGLISSQQSYQARAARALVSYEKGAPTTTVTVATGAPAQTPLGSEISLVSGYNLQTKASSPVSSPAGSAAGGGGSVLYKQPSAEGMPSKQILIGGLAHPGGDNFGLAPLEPGTKVYYTRADGSTQQVLASPASKSFRAPGQLGGGVIMSAGGSVRSSSERYTYSPAVQVAGVTAASAVAAASAARQNAQANTQTTEERRLAELNKNTIYLDTNMITGKNTFGQAEFIREGAGMIGEKRELERSIANRQIDQIFIEMSAKTKESFGNLPGVSQVSDLTMWAGAGAVKSGKGLIDIGGDIIEAGKQANVVSQLASPATGGLAGRDVSKVSYSFASQADQTAQRALFGVGVTAGVLLLPPAIGAAGAGAALKTGFSAASAASIGGAVRTVAIGAIFAPTAVQNAEVRNTEGKVVGYDIVKGVGQTAGQLVLYEMGSRVIQGKAPVPIGVRSYEVTKAGEGVTVLTYGEGKNAMVLGSVKTSTVKVPVGWVDASVSKPESVHVGSNAPTFVEATKIETSPKNLGEIVPSGVTAQVSILKSISGEPLAELTATRSGEIMGISEWQTLKPGKGYGKTLLSETITNAPKEVTGIRFNGFTEQGEANAIKVLSNRGDVFKDEMFKYGYKISEIRQPAMKSGISPKFQEVDIASENAAGTLVGIREQFEPGFTAKYAAREKVAAQVSGIMTPQTKEMAEVLKGTKYEPYADYIGKESERYGAITKGGTANKANAMIPEAKPLKDIDQVIPDTALSTARLTPPRALVYAGEVASGLNKIAEEKGTGDVFKVENAQIMGKFKGEKDFTTVFDLHGTTTEALLNPSEGNRAPFGLDMNYRAEKGGAGNIITSGSSAVDKLAGSLRIKRELQGKPDVAEALVMITRMEGKPEATRAVTLGEVLTGKASFGELKTGTRKGVSSSLTEARTVLESSLTPKERAQFIEYNAKYESGKVGLSPSEAVLKPKIEPSKFGSFSSGSMYPIIHSVGSASQASKSISISPPKSPSSGSPSGASFGFSPGSPSPPPPSLPSLPSISPPSGSGSSGGPSGSSSSSTSSSSSYYFGGETPFTIFASPGFPLGGGGGFGGGRNRSDKLGGNLLDALNVGKRANALFGRGKK